ncbi:unnamed protein product [Merluccius merluccius]
MKKQVWCMTFAGLAAVGFTLVCVGVYLLTLQGGGPYDTLRVATAYVQLVAGFLAMLASVLGAFCHSMRSKLYMRGGRGHAHAHRHRRRRPLQQIYTIDRPFPPSYDESQRSQADRVPGDTAAPDSLEMVAEDMGAPPLYTEHSSDVPDCTWAWERPPPYSGPAPTS